MANQLEKHIGETHRVEHGADGENDDSSQQYRDKIGGDNEPIALLGML